MTTHKWECTDEESQAQQEEFKKNYPPFKQYQIRSTDIEQIVKNYTSLLYMQNGMDTDDYLMNDSHKVNRYIKGLPEDSNILFLGTGTGREMLCAEQKFKLNAFGTTLGSRNIEFAVNHLGISRNKIYECLNENLPFHSECFDAVHGYQVFEHTIAPLIFLLEVGRVLKPGGELLLEWPPAKDYNMDENPHHQICLSPGQAEALLKKAGFINIELLDDQLDPITEDAKWRCDQELNKGMLVAKANKAKHPPQQYISIAWDY